MFSHSACPTWLKQLSFEKAIISFNLQWRQKKQSIHVCAKKFYCKYFRKSITNNRRTLILKESCESFFFSACWCVLIHISLNPLFVAVKKICIAKHVHMIRSVRCKQPTIYSEKENQKTVCTVCIFPIVCLLMVLYIIYYLRLSLFMILLWVCWFRWSRYNRFATIQVFEFVCGWCSTVNINSCLYSCLMINTPLEHLLSVSLSVAVGSYCDRINDSFARLDNWDGVYLAVSIFFVHCLPYLIAL